jgi:hypothetical protein
MRVSDIAFIVFSLSMILVGAWMTRAQDAYLRAYAASTGAESATTGDLIRRLRRPWRLVTTAPLTSIARATSKPQSDPAVEALRQRYLARRRVALALLFAGFLAFSMVRSAHL